MLCNDIIRKMEEEREEEIRRNHSYYRIIRTSLIEYQFLSNRCNGINIMDRDAKTIYYSTSHKIIKNLLIKLYSTKILSPFKLPHQSKCRRITAEY